MAYYDSTRREIVLRIVYDGLATAGKTTNLRSLHQSFLARASGDIYVPAERAGRTTYFDWLELMSGYVDDWALRCQVLTVPGQFAIAERRFRLLAEVDAVVAVCDSTPKGMRAARIAWVFLGKVLAATANADVPIVVQANKQDLPNALGPDQVRDALALPSTIPVVAARAREGDGVRPTFIAALDRARSRVRSALREGGVAALRPSSLDAEQLYAAMLSDSGAPSEGAAEAIEAALEEMDRQPPDGEA